MKLHTKHYWSNFLLLFFFAMYLVTSQKDSLEDQANQLAVFDTLNQSKVLVLGTYHFKETVLHKENQSELENLITILAKFKPTKVVLEWEPEALATTNAEYQKYLSDSLFIEKRHNEVYQLGFRLAKKMNHDSIYLFDDQTEFIGSLEGFTFDSFGAYAQENDAEFYDEYLQEITQKFRKNQEILKGQKLFNQIVLRNSPKAQKYNAQRMHSFEVRVGIQKSWIGPDWVGRFYRRNVRMMANVIKFNKPGDRILIIVGDNHKWILDELFEKTPDFKLVSSWDFFKTNLRN